MDSSGCKADRSVHHSPGRSNRSEWWQSTTLTQCISNGWEHIHVRYPSEGETFFFPVKLWMDRTTFPPAVTSPVSSFAYFTTLTLMSGSRFLRSQRNTPRPGSHRGHQGFRTCAQYISNRSNHRTEINARVENCPQSGNSTSKSTKYKSAPTDATRKAERRVRRALLHVDSSVQY